MNYVDALYARHGVEFKMRAKEIAILYEKKASIFLRETEEIFKSYAWPRGKYIVYLSIFDFCPRFLEEKTFQIFMYDSDEGILFTIAHEMLHFIFYDYCLKRYPAVFRGCDTEEGSFWEVADLFNAVMQRTPSFIKLHGSHAQIG